MEKEVNKIITGNVIIPKVPAWTFIGGVVLAGIAAYVTLKIQVAHVEKDVYILQKEVSKNEISIKENDKTYKDILTELKDINAVLKLKQDKKFIE